MPRSPNQPSSDQSRDNAGNPPPHEWDRRVRAAKWVTAVVIVLCWLAVALYLLGLWMN